ncbi:MAG TPA: amidohydrolase family protein [Gemmatimonadaceae bacterium]|nr:amidohydrolase family protein [Gemmatimonadaceae bacterium]
MMPKHQSLRPAATLAIALAVAVTTAPALDAQIIPAAKQSRPIALTGARINTVANGVIENGTIVFVDGKITAVGRDVAIPANAQRIDVAGKEIYPGLIGSHSQMGLTEIGGFDQAIDLRELGPFNPNARAHVAFNPETRHLGPARSNGVLVTVSAPAGGLVAGLSAAMMLDGWTWEEMTLKSEAGLIVNWPASGRDSVYDASIRELRGYFAEARAYRTARQAAPERHPSDSRLEAMIPVLERRIPVMVNANDVRQIQDAVTWAGEEGVRMVLVGGRDAGYVAGLLASRDIPVLLTSVLDSPTREWEPYDHVYSLPARLHQAGVKFGITGGASAAYAHRLPYEAGAAIAYGLPEDVALRAVTLSPAEFLGFADRVGSLEVGKDATLLITTGNPLEYATIVEQAYVEGRMIDMNDAHRNFFEKYSETVRQTRSVGPIVP